jgi:adenylate cyclase
MAKFLKSPLLVSFFIGAAVFIAVIGIRALGYLEFAELIAYDWCKRAATPYMPLEKRVVLVEITDLDIQNIGQWPLTDQVLAVVLEKLAQLKPRAIGLDIYRDLPVPPGTESFERTMEAHPNIIATMKFGAKTVAEISPPPVVRYTDRYGFNDVLVDPGGIVRRGIMFLGDGDNVFYSFSLRLALLYLQHEGILPQPDPARPELLRLGKVTIERFLSNDGGYRNADDRGYQFLIDYGSRTAFPSFTLADLLEGKIESDIVQDGIVILGTRAEGVKDFFFTPFSKGHSTSQQVTGGAIHASMISQFLSSALDGRAPMSVMAEWKESVWILIWSLIGILPGLLVRSPLKFIAVGLSGILALPLAVYALFLGHIWAPLVPPTLSWLASGAVVSAYVSNRERRERKVLMRLFSQHVSKEVAENIWKERDQFIQDGRPRSQKLTVTTMFTDFKGFTSVAEKMTPQELIDWLNIYLEGMAGIVMAHGGVIDTFTGDGLKADFGTPIPRLTEEEIGRDAVNAVSCAVAMKSEMERVNTVCEERGLPTVSMRIGLHTGQVVAGTLGSKERLKYTTIGDAVNIASRLESFAKEVTFGSESCRVVVGESTKQYLNSNFIVEEIGEVSLKGRGQKVRAFCVLGQESGKNLEGGKT